MPHDIILSQTKSQTLFNALRLANRRLKRGHKVKISLVGKEVELNRISDPEFDVQDEAGAVRDAGGKFLVCGTGLSCGNRGGRRSVGFRRSKTSTKSCDSNRLVTF